MKSIKSVSNCLAVHCKNGKWFPFRYMSYVCVCECTEHFLQYGLIFNVVESLILEEFGLDILEKIKLV